MKSVRYLLVVLAVVAATFLGSATATATTFDDVGAALRRSPLYVDTRAEVSISPSDQAEIRRALASAGTPIYVAVLPEAALTAAGGDPARVLDRLRNATGRPGTYAVLIGTSDTAFGFEARSTLGTVGDLANQAHVDNRDNPAGTISAFVASVGSLAAAGGLGTSSPPTSNSGGGGVWLIVALLAVAVAVGGGTFWLIRRRRRKRAAAHRAAQTDAVRRTLDEDITAFGESLDQLDADLTDPRLGEEGRTDLAAALDDYDRAKLAAAAMTAPTDAATVTEALDSGRWHLARAAARLAGEPLPERRPPCFFDPRHGPSTSDAPFTPAGGIAREVPVCAVCAATVASGQQPDPRLVRVGSTPARPYWDSGPAYASYTSGYYSSSGADMLSTVFLATMVGSVLSGSTDAGSGDYRNDQQSGSDWSGGGGESGSGGWSDGGGGGGFDSGGGGFDSGGGGFDSGGGGFDSGGW